MKKINKSTLIMFAGLGAVSMLLAGCNGVQNGKSSTENGIQDNSNQSVSSSVGKVSGKLGEITQKINENGLKSKVGEVINKTNNNTNTPNGEKDGEKDGTVNSKGNNGNANHVVSNNTNNNVKQPLPANIQKEIAAQKKVVGLIKDGKIKKLDDCNSLFKTKTDNLNCKRTYITTNADKLDIGICKKIGDKAEQQGCEGFFKNRSKTPDLRNRSKTNDVSPKNLPANIQKEIAAEKKIVELVKSGKIKKLDDCNSLFKTKTENLSCKRNYIIANVSKLDISICNKIGDKTEQQGCEGFFKNKKKK